MRKGSSGASRAAARIVSRPCSGISLPTKSAWNASAGCQPGRNSRSSARSRPRAAPPRLRQLGEVAGVLGGVGDDEVGAAQGEPVDLPQHAGRRRAGREAAAILDERLVQRDERVEEHGPTAGDPPCGGDVEVTWVADDDGVEASSPPAEEPRLASPIRAAAPTPSDHLPPPLPHARMPLDDVDARAAQARDHLGVARVVALVRAEVEDAQAQRRISSTCCSSERTPLRSS